MAATASAQTRTTGIPGRFILSAEGRHLVVDASAATGGVAEAFVAQELLVGALATCAQAVISLKADEMGLTLRGVTVDVESSRDPDVRPPVYDGFTMDFEISGASQDDAETLVTFFQENCPIYHTLASAAPMKVTIRAVA
ncbi:OsmC family protein [Actinomadura sp. 1N219]|uniref:OsmC family protein n=1 Tax=Actinomadura sp. 1N219 TaxID=3375152 RepID=UPI0037A02931